MSDSYLLDSVIFLAAAVLMVPIFKRFGLGSVLGYLAAGAIIGPWGLEYVEDPEAVLHFAELGVVMLLFIIGLELKPARLWTMRRSVFGLGAAQVFVTFVVLAAAASVFGYDLIPALVAGFALALSSTAFALQVMAERGELSAQSGRAGFSILLFQDLAVIPVLALVPLFGPLEAEGEPNLALSIALIVAAIGGIVIGGRYALRPLFRLIAVTKANEIFTAAALLVVLGVAVLMNAAGLSMALGAFIAGVLLADCEFRHQIAADIEPFRGLLLGLFFLSVGMTVDFGLLWKDLSLIVGAVVLPVSLKALTIWALAQAFGYKPSDSLKVGLTLSQGGGIRFCSYGGGGHGDAGRR